MQGLVQNGLPSYSWEELHFLLWLKLFPGFVLFLGTPKTEAGGAVGRGQRWVGSHQCSFSIPWSRVLPVDGDSGSPHSSAADKGFQTLPVPRN